MDFEQLKANALEIYKVSMELQKGTPRTNYRRMKLDELTGSEKGVCKSYLENLKPAQKSRGFCL